MIIGYGVVFRFLADDSNILEKFIDSKKIEYRIIKKGETVDSKFSKYAKENTLITKMIETESIEELEDKIIEMCSMFNLTNYKEIKRKDVWISTLSYTDQYGFELPDKLLGIFAKNKFSLVLSSEFI